MLDGYFSLVLSFELIVLIILSTNAIIIMLEMYITIYTELGKQNENGIIDMIVFVFIIIYIAQAIQMIPIINLL